VKILISRILYFSNLRPKFTEMKVKILRILLNISIPFHYSSIPLSIVSNSLFYQFCILPVCSFASQCLCFQIFMLLLFFSIFIYISSIGYLQCFSWLRFLLLGYLLILWYRVCYFLYLKLTLCNDGIVLFNLSFK